MMAVVNNAGIAGMLPQKLAPILEYFKTRKLAATQPSTSNAGTPPEHMPHAGSRNTGEQLDAEIASATAETHLDFVTANPEIRTPVRDEEMFEVKGEPDLIRFDK